MDNGSAVIPIHNTPNLPSMCFAYVSFIALATLFSMAWYKIVMQQFLVVYHGISHFSHVFSWYTHLLKGSCVYQGNTCGERDIARYTTQNVLQNELVDAS